MASEYVIPRFGITNFVTRNKTLKTAEFSSVLKLSTEAGLRETRVFTEDGVLEATMVAHTEKA